MESVSDFIYSFRSYSTLKSVDFGPYHVIYWAWCQKVYNYYSRPPHSHILYSHTSHTVTRCFGPCHFHSDFPPLESQSYVSQSPDFLESPPPTIAMEQYEKSRTETA